jgi:tetratricopeptide (TPR) repeat protein
VKRATVPLLLVFATVAGLVAALLVVRGPPTSSGPYSPEPAVPSIALADVTAAAGIDFVHEAGARGEMLNPETFGPGGGWFDHDGDGRPDLLLVNGNVLRGDPDPRATSTLYRNLGDGSFDDRTAAAGLEVAFYGMGFAAADADNDGDQDLLLYGLHRSYFFLNDGAGRFHDATAAAGLEALRGWVCAAAFLDYDRDGALDLFAGNYVDWRPEKEDGLDCTFGTAAKKYCPVAMFDPTAPQLFRGRGDGVFVETTASAGLAGLRGKALGVTVEDYDRDGFPDLFVANDSVPNFLLRNRGDGTFEERGVESGFAIDASGAALAGMGIDAAWAPDGGPLLVAIGNFAGEPTTLHVQDQVDYFIERSLALGVGGPTLESVTFGLLLEDLDLDGRVDLAIANGHVFDIEALTGTPYRQRAQAFVGRDGNRFEEARPSGADDVLARPVLGRALAAADWDADGDLDLALTVNQGRALLLRNDLPGRPRFVRADLRGTRSNRDAIGAEVTLVSEIAGRERTRRRTRRAAASYLAMSEREVTFGLMEGERPLRLEVRWPSGLDEDFGEVEVGREVLLVEGEGRRRPGAGIAVAPPGTGENSVVLRQRGLKLLDDRRPAEALAAFEGAIALDRRDFVAWRALLIALDDLRRAPELDRRLAELAEVFPSASLLASHFAVVLRESGRRRLAERVFEAAARIDPDRPDVRVDLGNLAYDRGDLEAALRRYGEALERDPRSLEALANAGKVCLLRKDLVGARRHLERALAIHPDSASALCDLGGVLIAEDRLDEAEEALLRARDLARGRETRISAHGNLGVLYLKRRDHARAIESFEKVLELDPGDEQARRTLERLRS